MTHELVFTVIDRYERIESLWLQTSEGEKPFYFIEIKEGRLSKQPANRSGDIEEIIEYYTKQINSYKEFLPNIKEDKVLEVYNYFIEWETEFVNRLIAVKNSTIQLAA